MTEQLKYALWGKFSSSLGCTVALPATDPQHLPCCHLALRTSVCLSGLWSLGTGCPSWLMSFLGKLEAWLLFLYFFVSTKTCARIWLLLFLKSLYSTTLHVTVLQWQLCHTWISKNSSVDSITHGYSIHCHSKIWVSTQPSFSDSPISKSLFKAPLL